MQNNFDFDLFMETSAKTGFNAQNIFVEAGKILYNEYVKYKEGAKLSETHARKKLEKQEKKSEKKKCC